MAHIIHRARSMFGNGLRGRLDHVVHLIAEHAANGFVEQPTLAGLGLALRDSNPGFDPMQAIERYDEDNDEDADFAETEQY